jgi:hypothetical protein
LAAATSAKRCGESRRRADIAEVDCSRQDAATSFYQIPQTMSEIIGIDHIYITVSDMGRSEAFYDRAMNALGFRRNTFAIDGDGHIQYFNRNFGYVLRSAKSANAHDSY